MDNTTAIGIVNSTIKRQRSHVMEMRYFWLLDQYAQQIFNFQHPLGQENLVDYPLKHHTGKCHQHVRSYYLHTKESPVYLPRAVTPSTRRGCAEILVDPYYKLSPLPRLLKLWPIPTTVESHYPRFQDTKNWIEKQALHNSPTSLLQYNNNIHKLHNSPV